MEGFTKINVGHGHERDQARDQLFSSGGLVGLERKEPVPRSAGRRLSGNALHGLPVRVGRNRLHRRGTSACQGKLTAVLGRRFGSGGGEPRRSAGAPALAARADIVAAARRDGGRFGRGS